MSAPAAKYALQKAITRAIKAVTDAGVEVGGVDVLPDGTVRILTKDSVKADPYDAWKRARANG
jgi:hypothetical protein